MLRFIRTCFVLLFSSFICTYSSGQVAVDSSRIVRVLTFNIYHGETMKGDFDLDLIAKVIRSVRPDLVALQEVDFNTNRAKKMDLATELGYRTGLAPLFGATMSFDGGEYGLGILSAYSFVSSGVHALGSQPGNEPRAALEAKVVLKSGDAIQFISTHLNHTRDETDRINQANKLNDLFAKEDKPAILAGDLNARPESKTMEILLREWSQSCRENIPTAPSVDPRAKIDYVLFRPANRWKVLETRVIDEEVASDHRPVLSVMELLTDGMYE